ncbi:MAG TPA: hypothetical protein VGF21_03440 [Thermoleophilaceae bacterium]
MLRLRPLDELGVVRELVVLGAAVACVPAVVAAASVVELRLVVVSVLVVRSAADVLLARSWSAPQPATARAAAAVSASALKRSRQPPARKLTESRA